MIRFNCHCTHEFLVPDDQAGGMVQCPKCSRLNDVPLLNDVANLDEGGIFKIGEGPKAPGSDVIPKTSRAFTRDKRDDRGNDIDMRPTVEEFLNIGAEEIPLAMADEERPGLPKYDPLTGELVETIKIKPSDQPIIDPKTIPVASGAVSYAAADLDPPVTPAAILLHLFKPVNLFVMSFVIAVHIFFGVIESLFIVGTSGLILSIPFITIFGIFGVLTAHYGMVVDEIAFGNADELPRPMRDLSLGEDFLKPFLRFHAAMILSFWPMLFRSHMTGQVGAAFFVTCLLFCFFFFPALLMTALLGESYLNLRPDRVIGTIRACGASYWIAVIAFAVGGVIYLGSNGVMTIALVSMLLWKNSHQTVVWMAIAWSSLLLGVYFFHFACWYLGMLYRANHEKFPWILQQHIHSRRTDTLAQLEACASSGAASEAFARGASRSRRAARRDPALRKSPNVPKGTQSRSGIAWLSRETNNLP